MMKAIAGLFFFQVTLTLAANFSPYRGKCSRFGKFDRRIEGSVLAGHVISTSQVSTRIDCTFECLSEQRCSSFNYQEGEGDVHDCELNSESKETKPLNLTEKAGYSYYGTGQNVPSACASSPCINDGTCEESCMEGTGYKCVCIDGRTGDKCQQWTSTAQDYEVLFPQKSITDYIETDLTETLPQFTLCYWMKSTLSGWTTFFSLQTPNNKTDLRFRCGPQMFQCVLEVVKDIEHFDLPPVVNDMWHHICVSWENVNGLWDVIVNGAVMVSASALRSKAFNVRPGKLILGLTQDFYNGGFRLSDAFVGKMAAFNIWNTKMANSEIAEMARSCSQAVGNVVDWRMFRHGIHGDAEIMSPQSCVSRVAESEFVLDFPARNVNNYVETASLPALTEFTLSFWIRRGYDGFSDAAILSYATAQEVQSFLVIVGVHGALNVRVMDPGSNPARYNLPPIVDDLWHHVCITWTNADGNSQVFLDGVLKYTASSYQVGVTIPSGGVMRIGQQQQAVGGYHLSQKSYRGQLAKLNMWSTVLDGSAIVMLLKSPGAENGDVIAWKDMRTALINGNAMVLEVGDMQITDCFTRPVGVSDQTKIPDIQMTASSQAGDNFLPAYGRLNGDRGDGWCASSASSNDEWLQVDFGATFQVCGMATQGDRNGNEWVTDFKLSYSLDGITWTPYKDADGVEVEFLRNGNSNTVDQHKLPVLVTAQAVRFHPTKRYNWNCLRVEVYVASPAQDNDFDLFFASMSSANYGNYSSPVPSLTAFTACLWVKIPPTSLTTTVFFSYASSSSPEAISIGYYFNSDEMYFNVNAWDWRYYALPYVLDDNGWHHVCVTWQSSNGKWCLYLDGNSLQCPTGYKTGETIPGNGVFILGQEQDDYAPSGGGFDSGQAFIGTMSRLNVWSFETDSAVIKQMSRGCGLWSGDAVAWYNFKNNLFGAIDITTSSSCPLAVGESEFVLDFPARDVNNYIETASLPALTKFTLCFWMRRGYDGFSDGAILSYATAQEIKSIQVVLGVHGGLNVRVMDSGSNPAKYNLPPIVDDLWHHVCITWTNSDGNSQMFLDGVLKYTTSGYQVGVTIPSGGVMRIGQQQQAVGGDHLSQKSYRGQLAKLNMWSTVLDGSAIVSLLRSPGAENGDVISWKDMRTALINGNVMLEEVGNMQITDCFTRPVGVSNQTKIPDIQMTASSQAGDGFLPAYGRLNGDRGDGWCASSASSNDEWLQVDLGATFQVCGVATQGDRNGNEWVTDFKLSYSLDGITWTPYKDADGVEVEFHRNGDSNTVDQHKLPVLMSAKAVRFHPTKRHNYNCLRVEVYVASPAQDNDFDLVFASMSSDNYGKYPSPVPSLTAFTVCVWVKIPPTSLTSTAFFSYASTSSPEAISMGYNFTSDNVYFNVNAANWKYYALSYVLDDNGWNHVCVTWQSSNGKWCLYLDGSSLQCPTGYKTGETIPGNGVFILGQKQDDYAPSGGGFDDNQAFIGTMSRLNVWSYVVSGSIIKQMSRGCGLWSGDAVAWYNFKNNIFGAIDITTSSSCSLAVYTLQAKRDAYCQGRYSSVDCGSTIRALFERKFNQVGKVWRCMYDSGLTEDSHTMLPVYDTTKLSGCLHSVTADLLAITE